MCVLDFNELLFLTNNAQIALINAINGNPDAWRQYKKNCKKNNLDYIVEGKKWSDIKKIKRGIYIWGFWIEFDNKKWFIPLYVGLRETNCILRVHEHLAPNGNESAFGVKSLFKIPEEYAEIAMLYKCIEKYNQYLIGATAANIYVGMANFFNTILNPSSSRLLFFHNRAFYVNKLPGCAAHNLPTGYHDIDNQNQCYAMAQLRALPACIPANNLADEMKKARNYLASHFCFTYAEMPEDCIPPVTITQCESGTKSKLINDNNIWTFSIPRMVPGAVPGLVPGLVINFNFNNPPLPSLNNLLGAELP